MSLKVEDFEGAEYTIQGGSYRTDAAGNNTNVRHFQRITLANGDQYNLSSPWWRWEKWMPNKEYRRFPDSRGHYRKVNDRYANLLDKAWKENFKPEGTDDAQPEN